MADVNAGRGAPKLKQSDYELSASVEGCSAVGIWPVVPPATVVGVRWADVKEASTDSDFVSEDELRGYSLVAN